MTLARVGHAPRAGLVAMIAAAGTLARADRMPEPPVRLPTFESTLANHLVVIVAPDPSAASVAIHVRYLGGVADEQLHGSTHLIERLMFAGTVHVHDGDFEAQITATGGWASSEVTADHLSTFEEVPPEALERALWLEAERMAGLADGITEATLARERTAIAAERRAAYGEAPYGLVGRKVQQLLWGASGNGNDPLADGPSTRTALRDVVTARIAPSRAVLVIAGRVDPAAATALATKYFAWIPAPNPQSHVGREHPVALDQPASAAVADAVPKLVIAFRTAAAFEPDAIALEVGARLLAGGRTSRLWIALVDGGLASDVHAEVVRQHRGGELRIVATARPGIDPARLADPIRAAIAALRDHEVERPELARAETALQAELVAGLENLAVRASTLADWSIELGTTQVLGAVLVKLNVSPSDLQRAAAAWLRDVAAVTVVGA